MVEEAIENKIDVVFTSAFYVGLVLWFIIYVFNENIVIKNKVKDIIR